MHDDPLPGAIGWIIKQVWTMIKLAVYAIGCLIGARIKGDL